MTNKKYEFTDEIKHVTNNTLLHRIRALIDFDDVKKGDLGGFIEEEHNLSHDGCSWVYDDSQVYGKSRVLYNAKVYNGSVVSGRSIISDNVVIEHSSINKQSFLEGYVSCTEGSELYNVRAQDHAIIIGSIVLSVFMTDSAVIKHTRVSKGFLESNAIITLGRYSEALPSLDLQKRRLGRDAYIKDDEDIVIIDAGGPYTVTIYKTKNSGVSLCTGIEMEDEFVGKLPEYIRWVINNEIMANKRKKKFIKTILSAVEMLR